MDSEYWQSHAQRQSLTPLDKPCDDCAVTCGFYAEYAESVMKQPKEIRDKAIASWFCHNNPQNACRGIYNYVKSKEDDSQ